MNLVFWHNIISPHQAPFMRELAARGHEVVVVATEAMSEERRKQGWIMPSLGSARIILGPDAEQVSQIIAASDANATHLIAGARGTPLGRQVARACRASGRRMGIITESPDTRGFGGPLRWAKYAGERITLGRHFDFILAMGQRGVNWFKLCGYPPDRIFPFAYVTEPGTGDRGQRSEARGQPGPPTILFVGQIIARKGVDLLLRAFALIRVPGVKLQLVGHGLEEASLCQLADTLGISESVEWLGGKNSAEIPTLMAQAKVMVLPSREDGWGAVVNESLLVGTPVICSTACGAADLIRQPWLGTVFPAGNVTALAEAMSDWSAHGTNLPEQRQRVRNWAQCIEALRVARYVEEILTHVYERGPRPQAPWHLPSAIRSRTASQ